MLPAVCRTRPTKRMTGLVPEVVREVVGADGQFAATETFGLVAVGLALILAVQREILRAGGAHPTWQQQVSAAALPLLLTVAIVLTARLASLVPG